jgi:hypothetical protein
MYMYVFMYSISKGIHICMYMYMLFLLSLDQWIYGYWFNKDFMIDYPYYQSIRKNLSPMDRNLFTT